MLKLISDYTDWLHGRWPSAPLEPLPLIDAAGQTSVRGVYIAGDLTGIPLLKFASDRGAGFIEHLNADSDFQSERRRAQEGVYDVAIIGCGVAGASAALAAKRLGWRVVVYEASEPFATLKDFTKGKPIFTYPSDFNARGELNVEYGVKESLVTSLDQQLSAAGVEVTQARIDRVERGEGVIFCYALPSAGSSDFISDLSSDDPRKKNRVDYQSAPISRSLRVLIAIGKSGEAQSLEVDGAELDKVHVRLHDPTEYQGAQALIVGGGDSAVEAAIALAQSGAGVTLAHRGERLTRPKADNLTALDSLTESPVEAQRDGLGRARAPLGKVQVLLNTEVTEITAESVSLRSRLEEASGVGALPQVGGELRANDVVFTLIGHRLPTELLRRSKVKMRGEWSRLSVIGLICALLFCVFLYHWKSYGWFPFTWLDPASWIGELREGLGARSMDKTTLLYTLLDSASKPSFYYTLVYSLLIGYFGWKRIRRRRTPYVTMQTLSLLCFQWIPLFLLPEIILPMMGRNGLFSDGALLRGVADAFFESYDGGIGEERAYWRAYGFVLAWPLMVYNWITHQPIIGWLILGSIQTFVILPWIVYRWGKGAFCGWICSCGALAETLGDTHRHKMPRGERWNRLNMLGQLILLIATLMLILRVWGWLSPGGWADTHIQGFLSAPSPLSYQWSVDIALAGFLGVGLYFHFSGRMWCRFACPLAALMHIYARFSRFRIFSSKERCISCQVCSSVCHQGIDVMSFASRGVPLEDPQCVRCSACVQACPTGVLSFGRLNSQGEPQLDRLPASLVQITDPRRPLRSSPLQSEEP